MKRIEYSKEKDEWLKKYRGISFKDVIVKIEKREVLTNQSHPNRERYPDQKIFVLIWNNYIYIVPYVETEGKIFLKTVYPNRKFTKRYLKGAKNEKKTV